jgi:hypothetical protein
VMQCTLRELQWLMEGLNIDTLQSRQVLHYKRV